MLGKEKAVHAWSGFSLKPKHLSPISFLVESDNTLTFVASLEELVAFCMKASQKLRNIALIVWETEDGYGILKNTFDETSGKVSTEFRTLINAKKYREERRYRYCDESKVFHYELLKAYVGNESCLPNTPGCFPQSYKVPPLKTKGTMQYIKYCCPVTKSTERLFALIVCGAFLGVVSVGKALAELNDADELGSDDFCPSQPKLVSELTLAVEDFCFELQNFFYGKTRKVIGDHLTKTSDQALAKLVELESRQFGLEHMNNNYEEILREIAEKGLSQFGVKNIRIFGPDERVMLNQSHRGALKLVISTIKGGRACDSFLSLDYSKFPYEVLPEHPWQAKSSFKLVEINELWKNISPLFFVKFENSSEAPLPEMGLSSKTHAFLLYRKWFVLF